MDKVFIIAEAGVNHNGSLDLALKLCDAAKEANADAIKFQTWKTELVLTKKVSMANYQLENIGKQKSQFEMAKELELNYDSFLQIKKYCDKIGITFLSTPDEEVSLDFLVNLGVELIKVGSGEVTNIPYLRKVGERGLPVVLSTGMSNLGDVERAYNILLDSGARDVSLLHCTTNYPCPMNEVNLKAMITLKQAFKCRVGYSDHTLGIEVPIAAVAMGAEIIEKHFTLDKSMGGPDHRASVNPVEFAQMVKGIRNIERALGDGIKKPNASEIQIEKVVRKKIVAKKRIKKGEVFTDENITVKRTEKGLSAELWDLVFGMRAKKNFEIDQAITLQ